LLPRGRFPFVLLFLEAPPERVDVNVHPAKGEIRLAESSAVHELVRRAIRSALEEGRPVASLEGFTRPSTGAPEPAGSTLPSAGGGRSARDPAPSEGCWDFSSGPPATTLFEPAAGGLGLLVPLAQYRESYILASDAEGLVIVDQHVAH